MPCMQAYNITDTLISILQHTKLFIYVGNGEQCVLLIMCHTKASYLAGSVLCISRAKTWRSRDRLNMHHQSIPLFVNHQGAHCAIECIANSPRDASNSFTRLSSPLAITFPTAFS